MDRFLFRYGTRWTAAVLLLVLAGCGPSRFLVLTPEGTPAGRQDPSATLRALLQPAWWPDAATDADAPALDPEALARAVHDQINAVRAAHGLPALAWSDALQEVARAHSRDMAAHAYFDHVDRRGDDATRRARQHGVHVSAYTHGRYVEGVGENLYLTSHYVSYSRSGGPDAPPVFEWKTPEQIARQTVAAWMQSPTHRANLLYADYHAAAVGVALGAHETVFVTQNLISRPGKDLADARPR